MNTYNNCTFNIKYFYANGENITEQTQQFSTPKELTTNKALLLWEIAQQKGWIDENLQRTEMLSLDKAAIIADEMGDKLGLTTRWKPFEILWNTKYLANNFNRGYSNENLRDFVDEVREPFAKV